ncbi:DUF6491 family protein [Rhodanobacter sp. L36]|jgi:hypothetical protein|uniref:DUF6491 family protein n=1 Tax=Rhodanobacter sp. L36 TaxID=1747221 RepID=UPI00131C5ABA|nr:DUF6491 family protein [Rhodanobacter sp. L36]
MKTIAIAMLLVLSTGTASALRASDGPVPHAPLRNADCIDTSQINDWHIVSDRTAIVRTGPKRYLVTLQSSCPQLSHPPGLIFHSRSNAMADQGKICGGIGETVYTRGQPACAIQSVSIIDKARFDQLTSDAKRYKGGNAPAH